MDDGFDKNPHVCSSFARFVPFQAHSQTSRARVIQGDLKGELVCGFRREGPAVRFSFLLWRWTWEEWREESRLIFTYSHGQTQMHLVRR